MNPLERLMYVSGDKPPKKMPTRQPMWNQGYTEPSVNTATPSIYSTGLGLPNVKKEVVIRPKPKDSSAYMPYNPSRDTWGEVAKFGTSLLADPIALGMSAYDFAQDPSWLNAGALGLDAFTPGNVGGFLKGIGEIGIAGAAAREFSRDKNIVSKFLRGGSIDPKDLPSIRTQIRIHSASSNQSLNPLVPTPLGDIPQIMPNRSNIMDFLKAQNAQKQAVIDFFNSHRGGIYNLPHVPNATLREYGPYERGAILEYYTPEVNKVVDKWIESLNNGFRGTSEQHLRNVNTSRMYRVILGKTPNQALNANLPNIPYSTRKYIEKMDDKIYNNTPNRFIASPLPESSPIRIENEEELRNFANLYQDLFNKHLNERGITDLSVSASPGRNFLSVDLRDSRGRPQGNWNMGLNGKAMEKIVSKDWSIPDFPHNSIDPYDEIPVMTMANTSHANLPPKAGLYSQKLMDEIKEKFGIRIGAGRNSQTRNGYYTPESGKIGSHEIWEGKVLKGKAWNPLQTDPNYSDFTKAISYALLPPLLHKVMQREENRKKDNAKRYN
jgi:hypothetical protein